VKFHELYVEDNDSLHGNLSMYVVMCYNCTWQDELAFYDYDTATKRKNQLKRRNFICDG